MTSPALGFETRGATAVIALAEHVEAGAIPALRSRCQRALGAGHRRVAVDLRAVDRMDTPTLGELCVALRAISGHGAIIAVVGADSRVHSVLELCVIDGLELHPTIRSALAPGRAGQRERRGPRWRGLLARSRPRPGRA